MAVDNLRKQKDAYINKAMKMFAKQGRDEKSSIKMANAMWKKIGKKRAESKTIKAGIKSNVGVVRAGDYKKKKALTEMLGKELKSQSKTAQRRLKKKE